MSTDCVACVRGFMSSSCGEGAVEQCGGATTDVGKMGQW